ITAGFETPPCYTIHRFIPERSAAMKPAKFVYHAPTSVAETLSLLNELRDQDAKVLAGGQSLMPLLNMRLARPRHVVDINGLRELDYIGTTPEGGLIVGG